MTSEYKQIILHEGKEKSLSRLHPWLFSGAIAKTDSDIKEGELVNIFSSFEEYLATGYFQNGSIAVKILTFDKQKINQEFIDRKIHSALQYHKTMGLFDDENNTIFRLVNAEGDFLPGLIVDFYADMLVIQFHSVGMYLMRDMIVASLVKYLPQTEFIYSKSSSTLPKNNIAVPKDEFLWFNKGDGKTKPLSENFYKDVALWVATENGCKFSIDFKEGQKTGFFIDQQSNRRLVSELSKDKTVLTCFCYTGGFSVAALKGGAKKVDSIDISKKALNICNANVDMNGFHNKTAVTRFEDGEFAELVASKPIAHESKCEDVVEYIDSIPADTYDMIILDPPAFAKHQKDINKALKGYRTINQKAMEKIKSGGLLFTFSCSQAVSRDDFATMLFSCAALARRNVRIVRRLPHNFDHPQSIFHPEGEYLKGFLLYVE